MHLDKLNEKTDAVILRAENGESMTGDELIVKAAGVQIRGFAVRHAYQSSRKERPQIAELDSDPVNGAAKILAKRGASIRHANS